ncbi:hypothetical protein V8D89_003740 [Ganoderma adspersum]
MAIVARLLLCLSLIPPAGIVSARVGSADVESTALIGNRVSTILADMILIVITWKFLPAPDITISLASIMLCNGIVLSILNILQLVLTVGFLILPDAVMSNLSYFTGPLSSVLVSHFLLDLQKAHQRVVAGFASDNPSQAIRMSINLAGALGSIGATVGPASDHVEDEDGHTMASEGVYANEGEASYQSQNEDEFAIMEGRAWLLE